MKYSIVLLTVLGTLCLSPSNAADLKCNFQFHKDDKTCERSAYTCINDQNLPEDDSIVTNVIGDHLFKDELQTKMFTNADVEIVQIETAFIREIPKKLIKFFPKMTKLSVTPKIFEFNPNDYLDVFNKLKKLEISVYYLRDYVFDRLVNLQELILNTSAMKTLPPMLFDKLLKLEVIKVHGSTETGFTSKLDQLPAYLFKNNKHLRDISFHSNGLTCIHDGLFEGLNKLKSVSFDNPCIKADLSTTVTLSLIKKRIHSNCQKCGDPTKFASLIENPTICPAVPGPNDPPGCRSPISCYQEFKQLQEEHNKLKAQKNCNSKSSLELVFKHKQNE